MSDIQFHLYYAPGTYYRYKLKPGCFLCIDWIDDDEVKHCTVSDPQGRTKPYEALAISTNYEEISAEELRAMGRVELLPPIDIARHRINNHE